jgi:Sporulation and spore germination
VTPLRALAAVLAIVTMAGCRSPGVTILRGSELPSDVYGPPQPTPTPGEDLPKRGDVWLVKNERLKEVKNRPLAGVAQSEGEALLLALLQGPVGLRGVSTEIPGDTRFNSLEVEEGVATVDLSENFELGADRSLAMRVAQVVYTLTEDPVVDAVQFSFEGVRASVIIPGSRLPVPRPVRRSDYSALTLPPPKG